MRRSRPGLPTTADSSYKTVWKGTADKSKCFLQGKQNEHVRGTVVIVVFAVILLLDTAESNACLAECLEIFLCDSKKSPNLTSELQVQEGGSPLEHIDLESVEAQRKCSLSPELRAPVAISGAGLRPCREEEEV